MKKITAVLLMGLLAVASAHAQQTITGPGNQLVSGPFGTIVVGAPISGTCPTGQTVYSDAGNIGCRVAVAAPNGPAGGDLAGTYPNPTLATTQTGAHTWSAIQTFTLAPVFTDASGSRTALGLGALATVTPGTGVATALGVNVGSAGAPVVNGGVLGTPSSGVATNLTGTAAGLTAGAVPASGLTGTALASGVTGSSLTGVSLGTLTTNAVAAVGQLPGTATDDSAAAGKVGEFFSSTVTSGSQVPLTSATAANLTSISLTPGDWEVWTVGYFVPGSTSTVVNLEMSLSTTSATANTTPGFWGQNAYSGAVVNGGTANPSILMRSRFLLSVTTPIYAVANSVFGVSTNAVYGYMAARRMR